MTSPANNNSSEQKIKQLLVVLSLELKAPRKLDKKQLMKQMIPQTTKVLLMQTMKLLMRKKSN